MLGFYAASISAGIVLGGTYAIVLRNVNEEERKKEKKEVELIMANLDKLLSAE